jgi:hypothetical protein
VGSPNKKTTAMVAFLFGALHGLDWNPRFDHRRVGITHKQARSMAGLVDSVRASQDRVRGSADTRRRRSAMISVSSRPSFSTLCARQHRDVMSKDGPFLSVVPFYLSLVRPRRFAFATARRRTGAMPFARMPSAALRSWLEADFTEGLGRTQGNQSDCMNESVNF